MSKPRPMPFWATDWLSSQDVRLMSAAERGGYIDLIAHCWDSENCTLPADDEELRKLSGLSVKQWKVSHRLRNSVQEHPIIDSCRTISSVFNRWEEDSNFRAKCSENGKVGLARRWNGNSQAIAGQLPPSPSPSPTPSPSPKSKSRERGSLRPSPSDDWPGLSLISAWMPEIPGLSTPESRARVTPRWIDALVRLEEEHGWEAVEKTITWIRLDEFHRNIIRTPAKLRALDRQGIRWWDRVQGEMSKRKPGAAVTDYSHHNEGWDMFEPRRVQND